MLASMEFIAWATLLMVPRSSQGLPLGRSKSGVQVSALTLAHHCPHLIIYVLLADTLELQAEKQGAHSDEINAVAFSPDGKTIVSGSKDKTIKVWELTSWCREKHLLFSHVIQQRVVLVLWLNKQKLLFPDDVLDLLIRVCI